MPKLNYDLNLIAENNTDQKISFPLEIQGNLQNAMNKFVEQHPNWDQYNLIQAAIVLSNFTKFSSGVFQLFHF